MLEVTVFICGAAVMILELAASRIVAPFLGTSLVVWTALIGIVLCSLSVGYWWGGRLADRNPKRATLAYLIAAAGITISISAGLCLHLLSSLQQLSNFYLQIILAVTLLFAPASVLLGMTTPYATKLKLTSIAASGSAMGRMYALATLGSIMGTFMAGFFLLFFLESTVILQLLALAMILLSIGLAPRSLPVLKIFLLAVVIFGSNFSESAQQQLERRGWISLDSSYNRIIISQGRDQASGRTYRSLSTGPKWQQSAMFLDDPVELMLPYTRFFRLLEHFTPDFNELLLIGGGGYAFPKYLQANRRDFELTVVELDPTFTRLAQEYFAFSPDHRVSIYHQDGRIFLNQAQKQYDAIILDAFNSVYSVPFQLTTREAIGRMGELLSADGVLIINLISSISGRSGRLLRSQLLTLETVFPVVLVFPVSDRARSDLIQNIILVALKSGSGYSLLNKDPEISRLLGHLWTRDIKRDLPVLTDALAPVEYFLLNQSANRPGADEF